ncbi:Tim17-domain-containing protein [Choiromyces venosus 120613-1]|uniref:Tim17-domain-containing protein n=1 Tax=Choiromyces venosus 120613-1 TaxID=1336337 RepID=A0A3N4KC01_9PEZI|nr:Tim17-domain-containing protein [Choiromyces venosus 120613-1]
MATSTSKNVRTTWTIIINDFGGAFCMGAIGGGTYHGIQAFRNVPPPYNILRAVSSRAPVSAGSFGIWGGVYSAFECGVRSGRGREDAFNAVFSGFLTGGTLALRRGVRAAGSGALGGAALLAVVEGVGVGAEGLVAAGVLGAGAAVGKEVVAPENFTFC